MNEPTPVFLRERRSDTYVAANLIQGLDREAVEAAQNAWRQIMVEAAARMDAEHTPPERRPQHGHWDWRTKYDRTHDILAFQMFGIECQGEMQGLMLVQTDGKFCRIPSQARKPLVYVYFVETAPWNSPLFVSNPRYGQVGRVFIAAAIELSRSMEFSGRIGLHSLPQSEAWYVEQLGMIDLGRDPGSQNLKYFEMTPELASRFHPESL